MSARRTATRAAGLLGSILPSYFSKTPNVISEPISPTIEPSMAPDMTDLIYKKNLESAIDKTKRYKIYESIENLNFAEAYKNLFYLTPQEKNNDLFRNIFTQIISYNLLQLKDISKIQSLLNLYLAHFSICDEDRHRKLNSLIRDYSPRELHGGHRYRRKTLKSKIRK